MGILISLGGAATPFGLAADGLLKDLTQASVPTLYVALGLVGVAFVGAMASRPALRAFLVR